MSIVRCPNCQRELSTKIYGLGKNSVCSYCKEPVNWYIFPRYFSKTENNEIPENILIEGESACFYHSDKKAVVTCDQCGKFLCSLCDLELNDKHICPNCFNSGKKNKQNFVYEESRILYDDLALAIAFWPIFTFYFTILGSLISIFFAIRYWNVNSSVIEQNKSKKIIAIFLSLLEIIFWIILIIYLISVSKA
ncbi:MAG: hypothetical protein K8S23_14685 [Candidatus Cloacimonetes bacterium]|nr:hypothetical protein [Candidatus Cloacimonadota bacterium]